jgi:hypothetical protein
VADLRFLRSEIFSEQLTAAANVTLAVFAIVAVSMPRRFPRLARRQASRVRA